MLVEGASEHFNQAQLFTQSPEQGETPRPVQNQNMDIMTYSQLINGSILSIPKSWSQMSQQSTDDMLVAVYSFIKTYIGWVSVQQNYKEIFKGLRENGYKTIWSFGKILCFVTLAILNPVSKEQ